MKAVIVCLIALFTVACAPKVQVDIYKCAKLSDPPEMELKEEVISCPKGEKPKRGGCELTGDGKVAAAKVDNELCE